MRVTRTFTTAGVEPYEGIGFRTATSEIRNPDGSVVFRLDDIEVPSAWSQVAVDVLAQKYFRKAGVAGAAGAGRGGRRAGVAAAPAARRAGAGRPAGGPALRRRDLGQAGLRPARRDLDLVGLEGRLFRQRGGRPGVLRRAALHARLPVRRAQLAAVVQHRPELGLRHRRPGAGPLLRRRPRPARSGARPRPTSGRSRTPASSRASQDDLVNPGGIMDLWVREARLFKYGSGTGTNFSQPARRERAALGRRQVVGPDELPQDRRPRRRRDQVRRHHAPRRQDGLPRRRPPRHRGLRQLEGARGAEGRGAGRGLEAARAPPQRDPDRLPRRRAGRRGALRSQGRTPRSSRRSAPPAQVLLPESALQQAILFARQGFTRIEVPTYPPTGTPRPTSPSPARTPTTPCGSPTSSSSACSRIASGS